MRQQQDEPGRFSICSRQAAVVQMLKNGSNSFRKIFSTTQFLQMRESTSPYSERGRRDNVVPSL
ncbi:hypothetical protein D9F77_15785 [Escherichia coli]|nr:hypothetical protein [Escherichia coli]